MGGCLLLAFSVSVVGDRGRGRALSYIYLLDGLIPIQRLLLLLLLLSGNVWLRKKTGFASQNPILKANVKLREWFQHIISLTVKSCFALVPSFPKWWIDG